jgi:hypothetical protein
MGVRIECLEYIAHLLDANATCDSSLVVSHKASAGLRSMPSAPVMTTEMVRGTLAWVLE